MNPDIASRQIVDETAARCLMFLKAVGTFLPIRVVLARHGYTVEEHQLGWTLLHKVAGFFATFPTQNEEQTVREAITEIDSLDEPLFRRARAALVRLHPAQEAFVFAGLEPATGAGAVLSMETFLERLDELEHGAAREASRDADRAALETLGARGIDKSERERLGALVRIAQEGATPTIDSPAEEEARKDLLALRSWYQDWSETARTVIARRDHRIRLGLSKRKRARKDEPEPVPPTLPAEDAPPVVAPPPVPVPPPTVVAPPVPAPPPAPPPIDTPSPVAPPSAPQPVV